MLDSSTAVVLSCLRSLKRTSQHRTVPKQPNDDHEVGKRRTLHWCQDDGAATVSQGKGVHPKGGCIGNLTGKRQTAEVAAGCCVSQNGVLCSKAHLWKL